MLNRTAVPPPSGSLTSRPQTATARGNTNIYPRKITHQTHITTDKHISNNKHWVRAGLKNSSLLERRGHQTTTACNMTCNTYNIQQQVLNPYRSQLRLGWVGGRRKWSEGTVLSFSQKVRSTVAATGSKPDFETVTTPAASGVRPAPARRVHTCTYRELWYCVPQ